MELVLALMIVLLVIAAIAIKFTTGDQPFPYQKRDALFSGTERAFMLLLERAVGDEFKIINRVKLSELVEIRQGTAKRDAQSALMKASTKQLDFVLLDKSTLRPVAAVDLVNNDNKSGYKAQKDWFVRGVLETAGVPHFRFKVKNGYKPTELRDCIAAKLGAGNKLSPLNVRPVKSKGPTRPVRPIHANRPAQAA